MLARILETARRTSATTSSRLLVRKSRIKHKTRSEVVEVERNRYLHGKAVPLAFTSSSSRTETDPKVQKLV